jgi:protein-tyrosine-phosphatase
MKIEGLGDHRYGAHRSHQLSEADCEWADVVLAAEAANVRFVCTTFTSQGEKAVQLALFDHFASAHENFETQLRAAAAREPSAEFDVGDPAGGDQATYDACARQLWNLARTFASIVSAGRTS